MSDYDSIETVERAVRQEAEERFPDGEWTLEILAWCDGDFQVTAKHGCGETSAENAVRAEIVGTPFEMKRRLVESTQSERMLVLNEEEL